MRGTIGLNKEKMQSGTSQQPSGLSEAGIPIERAVSTRRAGKRQFMHGSIRRNQRTPKDVAPESRGSGSGLLALALVLVPVLALWPGWQRGDFGGLLGV